MPTTSEQFITRMKLRELRAQRDKLQAAYAALTNDDTQAADDPARLAKLYAGLRALTFAGQPFHPDIANLDLVLHDVATHRAAPDTVAFWRERLRRERERGQLRTDTVFVFGTLLDEWAARRATLPTAPQQDAATATLVERALQPAAPADYAALLDALVDERDISRSELATLAQQTIAGTIPVPVTPHEVGAVLRQLRAEIALARAVFPEQPFYVVKLDLQDYYPSLAHPLVLDLLQRIGLPNDEWRFFGRYLRAPLATASGRSASSKRRWCRSS